MRSRNFADKRAFFKHQLESGAASAKRVPVQKKTDDFLNNAARARDNVNEIEEERLSAARKNGLLSSTTSNKEIGNYASKVAYHAQATHFIQNPPSRDVFQHLSSQINNAEHPNGAAHSFKYGNLRDPARKRAADTRLDDPQSLNEDEEYTRDMAAAKAESLKEIPEPVPLLQRHRPRLKQRV